MIQTVQRIGPGVGKVPAPGQSGRGEGQRVIEERQITGLRAKELTAAIGCTRRFAVLAAGQLTGAGRIPEGGQNALFIAAVGTRDPAFVNKVTAAARGGDQARCDGILDCAPVVPRDPADPGFCEAAGGVGCDSGIRVDVNDTVRVAPGDAARFPFG